MHNTGKPDRYEASSGEVLDTDGYIEALYDGLGIQMALSSYLDGEIEGEDIYSSAVRIFNVAG